MEACVRFYNILLLTLLNEGLDRYKYSDSGENGVAFKIG